MLAGSLSQNDAGDGVDEEDLQSTMATSLTVVEPGVRLGIAKSELYLEQPSMVVNRIAGCHRLIRAEVDLPQRMPQDYYAPRLMTLDERWFSKNNEVKEIMERKRLNLSRHRIEEHDMLNWLQANRKKMNAGGVKGPRLGMIIELLALCERYMRKNQYE